MTVLLVEDLTVVLILSAAASLVPILLAELCRDVREDRAAEADLREVLRCGGLLDAWSHRVPVEVLAERARWTPAGAR
jgi:hypothetical protein